MGIVFRAGLCIALGVAAWPQTIQTIAGGAPRKGETYTATNLAVLTPSAVTGDSAGNIYVASSDGHAVYKLTPGGQLSRFVGTGVAGSDGDGGPAVDARVDDVEAIALDPQANLYLADESADVVRKVDASTGTISTIAGTAYQEGFTGDGGPAASALLYYPTGIAVDSTGNVFVSTNCAIREISAGTGQINLAFGTRLCFGSGSLASPRGLLLDGNGNLYVAEEDGPVLRFNLTTLASTVVAGISAVDDPTCFNGNINNDGCPANQISFGVPNGLALDARGNLYVADTGDGTHSSFVRTVAASTGLAGTAAGIQYSVLSPPSGNGDGGPATAATLSGARGVWVDGDGNLWIADSGANRIREVASATGIISTVAGNGAQISGDGLPATEAEISPNAIAADGNGDVFLATNGFVREINSNGVIQTIAGNGSFDAFGQPTSGVAVSLSLYQPDALVWDGKANLYIADTFPGVVWKLNLATATMAIVAGTNVVPSGSESGDGGPAVDANLDLPNGLALSSKGDLYIRDDFSVRVVSATDGTINTLIPLPGTCGLGGIALDPHDNLYVVCLNQVMELAQGSTTLQAIAGGGSGGDNAPAINAKLVSPQALAFDVTGNLFIADSQDGVREVLATSGDIVTIAGQGTHFDPYFQGAAADAGLVDASEFAMAGGNLYVATGVLLRAIAFPDGLLAAPTAMAFPAVNLGGTSPAQVVQFTNNFTAPLSLQAPTLGGVNASDFSLQSSCPATLAQGASCSLTLTFTPSAQGARTATITLASTAPNSPVTIPLSGAGTDAHASFDATALTFAPQLEGGTSAPQTLTLTDQGTGALGIGSVAVTGDFAVTSRCGSSLAANASCSTQVVFSPRQAGTLTGVLTLTTVAPAGTVTVNLTGQGQDFTLTGSGQQGLSATIAAGQSTQLLVSLAPENGLTGTVALSCVPLDSVSGLTCQVAPASVTLGSAAAATATVTVQTTARSLSPSPWLPPRPWLPWAALALCAAACLCLRRRRRLIALPIAMALLTAACGGSPFLLNLGGGNGGTTSGTPAGTYTIEVTATIGTAFRALAFTVNVQ